jgi:hypothetical protein
MSQRNEKRDELHPYCQTLKPSDVESCTRLEEEAFPPHERATREKVSLCHLLQLYFASRKRIHWATCHSDTAVVLLGATCAVVPFSFSTCIHTQDCYFPYVSMPVANSGTVLCIASAL